MAPDPHLASPFLDHLRQQPRAGRRVVHDQDIARPGNIPRSGNEIPFRRGRSSSDPAVNGPPSGEASNMVSLLPADGQRHARRPLVQYSTTGRRRQKVEPPVVIAMEKSNSRHLPEHASPFSMPLQAQGLDF